MAKKRASSPPQKLTDTEENLLAHIEGGYQLDSFHPADPGSEFRAEQPGVRRTR